MKAVRSSRRRNLDRAESGVPSAVAAWGRRSRSRGSINEVDPMYLEWFVLCRPSVLSSSDFPGATEPFGVLLDSSSRDWLDFAFFLPLIAPGGTN